MRKNSFTRVLVLVALGLLFCATLAFGEKPKEVLVVNDANQPVPVAIANTPVPVTTGTKEPVAASGSCETVISACGVSDLYTVPTGKRLVVEYFSCSAQLAAGQGLTCRIWNFAGAVFVPVYLPTSSPSPGPFGTFIAAGQPVKLYAAAGETIATSVGLIGNFATAAVNFYVIGYLEDAP